MSGITCRPPVRADERRWAELYQAYLEFAQVPAEPQVVARVWGWLMDPGNEVEGLVAEVDGEVAGLLLYRRMLRTLRGTEVGYLSDMFIDPAYRRLGVARALLDASRRIGRERGWPQLRWYTKTGNAVARRLYDSYAPPAEFVAYIVPTGLPESGSATGFDRRGSARCFPRAAPDRAAPAR